MPKNRKYANQLDLIARFLIRDYNQELIGQTKLKHYHETKPNQVNCEICNKSECKLHRHRVRPGAEYTDENVIVVCVSCHKLIHKIYNETNANNESEYRLAILLAKLQLVTKE